MAIEFNCPYCTATVRVRDEASGRIGRCPMCHTRIRVPAIAAPLPSEPPPRSIEETPSDTDIRLFSPLTGGPLPDLAAAPLPPAAPVPSPAPAAGELPLIQTRTDPVAASPYLRKRRKKSSSLGGMVPPLLFGGLLVVIALVYWNWSQPAYQGTLTGTRLDPQQAISTSISSRNFAVPRETFGQIVDELRQRPSSIHSNLVNVTFGGGPEGLLITIRPGIDADLVKVPVLELRSVEKFVREHDEPLNNARIAEMQNALAALSEKWVRASEARKAATFPEYRYEIGYNAFLRGLGRICEAIVDNARYPCIHEDGEGALYFLIPAGARTFRIRERADLGQNHLPPNFEITVHVSAPRQEIRRETVPEADPIPIPFEPPPETSDSTPEF